MEKHLDYVKYQYKILNKIQKLQEKFQTLAKTAISHQNVRSLLIISINIIDYHVLNIK